MSKVDWLGKHLDTKLPMTLEAFRYNFDDWNDSQKLAVIKSLIWCSDKIEGQRDNLLRWFKSTQFDEGAD